MAPPSSRRSKEISTIPLPGIALGLLAALAASFAAWRALRAKRPSKSLEDEQQSADEGIIPLEGKEFEIKERDDSPFPIDSNGTITITQEPASTLAAGSLKPVFDAIEEVSIVQGRDAIVSEEGEEPGEGGGIDEAGRLNEFEKNEKGGETIVKEITNVEEGEIAEVVVEVEASLTVDDASVKALQRSILEKGGGHGEWEAGRKRTEEKDNKIIVVNREDSCGDGERKFTDQQPSPVLINGKKLDFPEEEPGTKGEPKLLLSESTSPSDGISESSAQEVSSAPVGPFLPATEGSLEAEMPGSKLGLLADSNQSGQGIGSPEDKKETPIKFSSECGVMDVKDDSEEFEGKGLMNAKGLDEGIAESAANSAEVLSNGSSSPKDLDDCESVGECELAVQSTGEVSADDFKGLQGKGENAAEHVLINGNSVQMEDNFGTVEAVITDATNSQKGQEGSDSTKSDIHRNTELLARSDHLLGDKTCISSDDRDHLYDVESTDKRGCLELNTSEECGGAESITEDPKPQPATQNLDNVNGTLAADNVKLEQEQPNLPAASQGIMEGSELISGRSTDNVDREDKDDELSGELFVKDRSPTKELEAGGTTRSYELNDCVSKKRVQFLDMDSAHHMTHNNTREADGLLLKGAVHQHGLQPKRVSASKAFEHLPLEIGFLCLLVAIVSYVLWYLEVLPANSQVQLAETY